MRQSPSRRRSGFTMIEMLVVFVVFAATVVISIRSVGDTLRRDRVGKAAALMSTDLERAFALAARQRTPIRLLMNGPGLSFSIADRADTTFKYRTRDFSTGDFQLDFFRSNKDSLDVMPNGLATDTLNLTMGIYSGGRAYSRVIRVTRAGLVRVGNQ
jgi:prepilin-type N-terminal cleavage/methylation domain-containing protein